MVLFASLSRKCVLYCNLCYYSNDNNTLSRQNILGILVNFKLERLPRCDRNEAVKLFHFIMELIVVGYYQKINIARIFCLVDLFPVIGISVVTFFVLTQ